MDRKGEGRETALLPGADSGKTKAKPGSEPGREPQTSQMTLSHEGVLRAY